MRITSHPNGFVRVTFAEYPDGSTDRLHIWAEQGYQDTDIHQHGSHFTSTILEGTMREELYEIIPGTAYENWTVRCTEDDDGNYHTDEHAPRTLCDVRLIRAEYHYAGDTYNRLAAHLHKVIAVKTPLITRGVTTPGNEIHTLLVRSDDPRADFNDLERRQQ